jgi:hypothetical protein
MTLMRKQSCLVPLIGLGSLVLLCIPIAAKSQSSSRGAVSAVDTTRTSAGVRAVEAIALARRLAAFGERAQSPLALVTAAQILIDNPTIPLDAGAEEDSAADLVSGQPRPLNVHALLVKARALSGGDAALGTVISQLDAASRTIPRGTVTGPRQRYQRIAAGGRLIHNIAFVGRMPAVVYVSGDGGTNLELGVYDSRGKLVTSDVTRFGDCLVRWVPVRSDRYRIQVRNRDGTPDWYLLITN